MIPELTFGKDVIVPSFYGKIASRDWPEKITLFTVQSARIGQDRWFICQWDWKVRSNGLLAMAVSSGLFSS